MGFDYSKYVGMAAKEQEAAQHSQSGGGSGISEKRFTYCTSQEAYTNNVQLVFLKKKAALEFRVLGQRDVLDNGALVPFRIPKIGELVSDDIARNFYTQIASYNIARMIGPSQVVKRHDSSKLDFIDMPHPDEAEMPTLLESLCNVAPGVIEANPGKRWEEFYAPGAFDSPLRRGDQYWFIQGLIFNATNMDVFYKTKEGVRVNATPSTPIQAMIAMKWSGYNALKDYLFRLKEGVSFHDVDITAFFDAAVQNQYFECPDLVNVAGAPNLVLTIADLVNDKNQPISRYEFSMTDQQFSLDQNYVMQSSMTPDQVFELHPRRFLFEAMIARSHDKYWTEFLQECGKRVDDLAPIVPGNPTREPVPTATQDVAQPTAPTSPVTPTGVAPTTPTSPAAPTAPVNPAAAVPTVSNVTPAATPPTQVTPVPTGAAPVTPPASTGAMTPTQAPPPPPTMAVSGTPTPGETPEEIARRMDALEQRISGQAATTPAITPVAEQPSSPVVQYKDEDLPF